MIDFLSFCVIFTMLPVRRWEMYCLYVNFDWIHTHSRKRDEGEKMELVWRSLILWMAKKVPDNFEWDSVTMEIPLCIPFWVRNWHKMCKIIRALINKLPKRCGEKRVKQKSNAFAFTTAGSFENNVIKFVDECDWIPQSVPYYSQLCSTS